VDGRRVLQGDRVLSAGSRERSSYALAYTGLADCYVLLDGTAICAEGSVPKGKEAAMTACGSTRISPKPTHLLRPCCGFTIWQWEEAEKEFKRSLELSPTYPTANHWYAEFVMTMGGTKKLSPG